jgi:hypothetical protein
VRLISGVFVDDKNIAKKAWRGERIAYHSVMECGAKLQM